MQMSSFIFLSQLPFLLSYILDIFLSGHMDIFYPFTGVYTTWVYLVLCWSLLLVKWEYFPKISIKWIFWGEMIAILYFILSIYASQHIGQWHAFTDSVWAPYIILCSILECFNFFFANLMEENWHVIVVSIQADKVICLFISVSLFAFPVLPIFSAYSLPFFSVALFTFLFLTSKYFIDFRY